MTNKERASLAVAALKKEYPDSICSLTYRDPLQLLISTRLAAQCTDLRVKYGNTEAVFRFSGRLRFLLTLIFLRWKRTSAPAAYIKQRQEI